MEENFNLPSVDTLKSEIRGEVFQLRIFLIQNKYFPIFTEREIKRQFSLGRHCINTHLVLIPTIKYKFHLILENG